MRPLRVLFCAVLLASLIATATITGRPASAPAFDPITNSELPLFFEANQGQTDPSVHFLARHAGYTLLLKSAETVLVETKTYVGNHRSFTKLLADSKSLPSAVLRMELVGANPAAGLAGLERLPGKVNYLIGNDPRAWHTSIPIYSRVRSAQVYPGVDLVFHGSERQLEYDFVVSPGADPNRVLLRVTGAKQIELDQSGDLVLHTANTEFRMHKPVIYQPVGSERRLVQGAFALRANGEVGFRVADYDRSQPLVIDPTITYATFLGGAGADNGGGIVMDTTTTPTAPKMYIPGVTDNIAFPEAHTLIGTSPGGTNYAFLAKIDPHLTGAASLDFLTFIGGSINFSGVAGCFSGPTGLALDTSQGASSVEVVISGETNCKDYPVTTTTPTTGADDMFVTRLMPSGAVLDLSIFFGGNGQEPPGTGLATVDSLGNVILASYTTSTNLPVTAGAYASTLNRGAAGSEDCFVAKLSRAFVVEYLTYLNVGAGTTNAEVGQLFCFAGPDPSGQILVAGVTVSSTAFNAVGGANGFQPTFQGLADTFGMKLNPSLSGNSQLTYASYLGGGGTTALGSAALLAPGVVALAGNTTSSAAVNPPDIPLKNAFLITNTASASSDKGIGFLTVVDTTKTGAASLICSTYFGGSGGDDKVQALAFDPVLGNTSRYRLVMGGQTTSTNFPTMNPLQATLTGAQNGWVSVMNVPTSSAGPKASLAFSTYIGGNLLTFGPSGQNEAVQGIAVDKNHVVYAHGRTLSDTFFANTSPTTMVKGFQTTCSSCSPTHASPSDDAIAFALPLPGATFAPATLTFAGQLLGTTSAAKSVTLTNDGGSGPLTISSISASGDYSQTNTCPVSPATLAVGGICKINVTFSPSVAGMISGAISLSDSAPSTVQLISLSGTGSTPLTISPPSLAFGTIAVGVTSAAKTVTLTNNQSVPLTFSFSASRNYAAVGSGTAPCGASFAAKAKCTMSVTFSPKANGATNGAVTITHNASFSPQEVALSGTGSGGATAPLTFSPASLTFAAQLVGTTSAGKSVTVTNSSASSLNITAFTATGNYTSAGSGTTPCKAGALAAGASCTFAVTFSPSLNGTIKGAVVFTDSAAIGTQVVNLSGTAALPVSFSPASLTFTAQSVGTTSAAKTVTLTNNQAVALSLTGIAATGEYTAAPGGGTPCGASVAAKGKCTFNVTFSPTSTGTIKGVVTVTHNAANSPQAVALSGTGQ